MPQTLKASALTPALASTGSVPISGAKAGAAPAQRAAFIPGKLAGAGLAARRTEAKPPKLVAPAAGGGKGGVAAEPAAPAAEGAAAEASSGAELFAGGKETVPDPAQEKTEEKLESAAPESAEAAEESEQAPEALPESGAEAPTSPSEAVGEPSSRPDVGADLSPSSVEGGEADKPNGSENNTPEAAARRQATQLARMEQADNARVAEQHAEEQDQERAEEQQEQKAQSGNVQGMSDAGLTPMEKEAGLAAVAEDAGGQEGAAATVGGGAASGDLGDQQEPKAPDTSAMDSESGLATAAALPAGAAPIALAGVGGSVDNSIQQEGQSLQAQVPEVEVGGQGDGSAVQRLEGSGAAERPRRIETGKAEPTPAPEPLPKASPSAIKKTASPRINDSATGAVSADDASRVQSSIAAMPTSDPGLAVPAGTPPTLRLAGDANPAHIAEQKQEIDAIILAQRNQGAAEIAAPAGDDNIRVRRPRESRKAQKLAVPGNAGTGSVEPTDDAVGIIAEEKKGDEVRSAIAQAQGEVAAKKAEHQTRVAEEKSKTQQQLAGLQVENANQQDAVRLQARNEVSKAKAVWSQAQRREIDRANEKTRAQLSSGDEKIAKEESRANQQASRHIAEGEREALHHKQEAETKAEKKKNEAEGESQGVFAGVASKVSSFFDALKKGLADIFEEATRLVRAAIAQAKKLAVAVIEKARQVVVSIIRAVGDALIAIGETLLAAFPVLRAKWRGFIEEKIRAAENRGNQLADTLKKNAQKLLGALGKGFGFLLDLHKKAIMAALDGARTVAMGAINFAKKVADALGPYVVLVKDIAKNPGLWISNLAAAVKDGIKNHLWTAFKSGVKEWFNQKLEQMLGLGSVIWNVLKKGGIALKEIGKMVWEGLKAAIPSALIAILIEKLVAMIVPAAGAVMLIIQGIQAAWGSVQRIIAALGKFVAFLKAVKKGDAGPSFAEMLAAAAIVVIDFVSHWLLKKLRGPASKIGARIKAIAKKIMAKIKAVAKKAVGWVKGKAKNAKQKLTDWRAKSKAKKDAKKEKGKEDPQKKQQDKEKAKMERLKKAVEALRPKVQKLLKKGISRLRLGFSLLKWRIEYRLSRLEIKDRSINAVVNPTERLKDFEHVDPRDLGRVLLDIFRKAEDTYRRTRFVGHVDPSEITRLEKSGLHAKHPTKEDIRRLEESAKAVVGGSQEALGTSRTESIEIIRRVEENDVRIIVPESTSKVTVKPSQEEFQANMRRAEVLENKFGAGPIHVPGAKSYPVTLNDANIPSVRGLRSVIETGRIPGTEATERITDWMKAKGLATDQEITGDSAMTPKTKAERDKLKSLKGKSPEQILTDQRALGRAPALGPAAISGASQLADVEAKRRKDLKSLPHETVESGEINKLKAAELHRAEAINNIFVRLARIMEKPPVDLITTDKDKAIQAVALAFREWISYNFPAPDKMVKLSEPEIDHLTYRLELALLNLLHQAGRE
ncbi:MAG: hypothetical protein IPJ27_16045 [Candidatus Accumulibacter sp.]|uniref:Uncharacterized protein n=1 Tax=Candidatus Accumulibacter proximus TaxID=2954385 RepID=A0A935UGX5_9PROT|nr:hypothetical protein [Candidatus Accumulibacter proximus]